MAAPVFPDIVINTPSEFIGFTTARIDQEDARLYADLTAAICTDGISASEFTNKGKKALHYSVGVSLTDMQRFYIKNLQEQVGLTAPDDFSLSDSIKESDKLYFKIKTTSSGKEFKATIKPPMTPKKYGESCGYQQVKCGCFIEAYYDSEKKTYGLVFATKEFEFIQQEAPKPTKVVTL
jgi:hypothetical protein